MALAKDPTYYNAALGGLLDQSSPEIYAMAEEEETSEKAPGLVKGCTTSRSPSTSSPSSTTSNNGYVYGAGNSLISFKTGFDGNFVHGGGSFLVFEQKEQKPSSSNYPENFGQDEYSMWDDSLIRGRFQDFNCVQSANNSNYGCTIKENPLAGEAFGWADYEAEASTEAVQEFGAQEAALGKRPQMVESTQALKRQCTSAGKKPKPKSTPSKDPQSIAAKNRRERISERLKILQELVPNGSKVDLVTMLEKAISYVKFLQLQVKVLATDEFWPAQGGKAPDLSQVKEVIDAILSSKKDTSSTSSK
ncbi:hypothetical protein NMG60_11006103 [Bertholletia excelsa]